MAAAAQGPPGPVLSGTVDEGSLDPGSQGNAQPS